MIKFSLTTFIKICLLDTGGRIAEVQKRLSGQGGYEFYKPLQKAIRLYCDDEPDAAQAVLAAPTNATERKYNQEAFKSFEAKFGSIQSLSGLKSPKTLQFKSAGISIAVDPLFEVTKSGVQCAYAIWPTQKPQLTQRYGAVACHILRRAYGNTALGNKTFHFCNLVDGKSYSEKQVNNNTNLILMADVTSLGTLVKQL